RQRAMLWEIQALTRARAVAGSVEIGRSFGQFVAALTNFHAENVANLRSKVPPSSLRKGESSGAGLSAYRPDGKEEIGRMRARIEKERTPAGKGELAIKTGAGGLIDAEFIAQALCLENGWNEPNTLRALQTAQSQAALPGDDAASLIDNYRKLR